MRPWIGALPVALGFQWFTLADLDVVLSNAEALRQCNVETFLWVIFFQFTLFLKVPWSMTQQKIFSDVAFMLWQNRGLISSNFFCSLK
jgi:hypothetical protein